MRLEGKARINPTEDPSRVLACILNIFPDCAYDVHDDGIEFSTDNLHRFVEMLEEQRIRNTALMVLKQGEREGVPSFCLNKQAALMKRVNFSDCDSTLGDLEIIIVEGARDLISEIEEGLG